ncbi:hypothetical protein [Neptuniibacter sp.]|uniref:hypothetical protein n=1 Tax=Neptuniibacter sp. TaxID=1962643 RepID=UPI0026076F59|nr:hypothetical protein [Neptuniibacter sp.]MCP4597014.1 hypothetical protein [Neptuniibacter sp.]
MSNPWYMPEESKILQQLGLILHQRGINCTDTPIMRDGVEVHCESIITVETKPSEEGYLGEDPSSCLE